MPRSECYRQMLTVRPLPLPEALAPPAGVTANTTRKIPGV